MIGQTIKDLRRSKKLSQTDFAKIVGVSQTTVTAWETGKAEPSSSAITRIADYFDVSTDYLLGRPEKSNNDENTDKELDEMLDEARSFDGHPITDNDRALLKDFLKSYYKNKES